MDRYLDAKTLQNKQVAAEDLHLIGAVSLFISSKYEDVVPIYLNKLV